jgi:hypothetical protein
MLTELTNRIAIVLEFISMMIMMMIIIITINKIITHRNNKRRLHKKCDETIDIGPYYNSMPKIGKRTLHIST